MSIKHIWLGSGESCQSIQEVQVHFRTSEEIGVWKKMLIKQQVKEKVVYCLAHGIINSGLFWSPRSLLTCNLESPGY